METNHIELTTAVNALSALAQEHRLTVFRELVQAGHSGLPAGVIADRLGVPHSQPAIASRIQPFNPKRIETL